MKPLIFVLLLALPFPFVHAQGGKGAVHYRITGTAVNGRTGEPIPLCHMVAAPILAVRSGDPGQRVNDGPRQSTEVDADAHGRFVLDLPAEGRYRLSGSARNFHTQALEAHGTFTTAIVLTKAAPTHAVVFRASSDAALVGEVTDEAGEAVRNAQVRLYAVGDATRTAEEPRLQMRNATQTDDRGRYELPGLSAGLYEVSVSARPWYATPTPSSQTVNGAAAPAPDPSLDVVFPIVWYPGVEEEAAAQKIDLKYGDRKQLDFHLNAIPAAHLVMDVPVRQPLPQGGAGGPQGPFQMMTNVQRMSPDGSFEPLGGNMRGRSQSQSGSQVDVGGLSPGTYRIVQPGSTPGAQPSISVLHVSSAGSVVDAGSAVPEIPVTIKVDGDPAVTPGQISLTDVATGRPVDRGGMFGMMGGRGGGRGGPNRRGGDDAPTEATVSVPPGSYEVTAQGRNSFITGVSATGAQVSGRVVKIAEGNPHLTVHMAAGMASVDGTATRQGKASVGAMVLLVPATMGDPHTMLFERRAQTATDGSFQLTNVIPGQYILLVIEHGWELNWRDVDTLRPYLLRGEPLDLAAATTAHPAVQGLTP